jgi:8-oxo-dGTP pyrophosphatase MutT (NUDIX family)
MICFDTEHGRFNFRSVAVITHNDHLLIHREAADDFWALPGGRVEFFETSEAAVRREILEEPGRQCKLVRHLWHVENFFELGPMRFHELANYFLVSLDSQPAIDSELDFKGIETSVDLIFRWVPLSELKNYNLKPEFLIDKANDLPNSIEAVKINEINA